MMMKMDTIAIGTRISKVLKAVKMMVTFRTTAAIDWRYNLTTATIPMTVDEDKKTISNAGD